ncbi:MAG: AAA family ATPase [Candidatus Promineifilaceae bacterium]
MLDVRLLGPPEITYEGAALSFPTRKALALFVYLVVEGGKHARDELASFLWPESDPGRVRATLRNCLYQARSALPEGYLVVEGEVVGFDFSADYTLDLEELAEAANLPLLSPAASSEAARPQLAAWKNAVELWRGEFLTGFSLGDAPEFDYWAGLERERWFRRMDTVYNRLSQFQFDQGQISAALRTAEQWRRHNPINETVYRRLMRLHMVNGERTAALQSYEKCRKMLAAELGVEPSPRTKALAARLETAELTTVERRRTAQTGVVNFSQGPFVGREGAFGALADAYCRTAADGFRTAAVVGEAGIGKTRLAEEFLAWAEAQGAAVLHGRSFESGRQLPYHPLVDALRACIEAINAPDDLLSDTWLLELSRLLPELLDRYPDLLDISQPDREESAARSRLFEAVVRLTQALAEWLSPDAALIFFLDDLQWADAASFDLLQYAARRWQEQGVPILMLTTVRSGAVDGRSPAYVPELAGCLSGLERLAPLSQIELAALSAGETADFLQTLGVEENDRFAH